MKRTINSMMLLLVGLLCSLTATAENFAWETLTVPSTVNLSLFKVRYFMYTAEESGLVTQKGCASLDWFTNYTGDTSTNVGYEPISDSGWGESNEKQYEVTAGTTYYLYVYPSDTYTVEFTFTAAGEGGEIKPELNVTGVEPAEGSSIGASLNSGTGEIILNFNFNGIYEYFIATSGSLTSSRYNIDSGKMPNFIMGLPVKDALVELYDKGMQPGDNLTITVYGLKDSNDNLYNDDGVLALNYKAAGAPLNLVSSTFSNSTTFYSYYAPGDPNGIFTFTFNAPVDATVPFTYETTTDGVNFTSHVAYGPVFMVGVRTDSDAQFEYATSTVNGNVVTVDCTGISFGDFRGLYSKSDNNLGFKLLNIVGTDGQTALGDNAQGSAGSYNYSPNYVLYENNPEVFSPVWTPADGQSIETCTSVALTIEQGSRIASFANMVFTAASETASVPFSQCTVTMNGTKKVIECPIPSGFASKKNVLVYVSGIVSGDGFSYGDNLFMANFNPATESMSIEVTPASGSTVSSLSEIQVLTPANFLDEYPQVTTSAGSTLTSIGYITPLYNASSQQVGIRVPLQPGLTVGSESGLQHVSAGTLVTITFAARAFELDGAYSPALTYTYTLGEVTPEPEDPENPEDPDPEDPDPEDPADPDPDPEPNPDPVLGELLTVPSVIELYSFVDALYTYKPTKSGLVTQSGCAELDWFTTYSTSYSVEYEPTSFSGYGSANEKQYEVTAGKTYYIHAFPMDSYTVTFTFKAAGEGGEIKPDLNVKSVEPAVGSTVGASLNNGTGEIILNLNFNGIYDHYVATSGSLTSSEYRLDDGRMANSIIGVPVKDAIMELYNQGMKEGDDMTITLYGLVDDKENLYNDDGVLTLSYTVLPAPIDMVSCTFADDQVFYSYYNASNPNGVFTFVFNGPVDATKPFEYQIDLDNSATEYGPVFMIGVRTDSDACYHYIPSTVSGNVVTVDCTGHKFGTFNGLFKTELDGTNNLGFKLLNIVGTDGQTAVGDGSQGSAGSYNFKAAYRNETAPDATPQYTNVTVVPTDPSNLNQFRISAEGYKVYPTGNGYIHLLKEDGTEVRFNDPEVWEDGTVTVTLPAETEPEAGVYTLVVPEGSLGLMSTDSSDTYFNRAYRGEYTLEKSPETGICGISADEGFYEVYNLMGVKVLSTADSTLLKKLSRGFYLINGKKVLVK